MEKHKFKVEMEFEFTLKDGLMKFEETVQREMNQSGCRLLEDFLNKVDVDGSPILVNGEKHTARHVPTYYQTKWGQINGQRYVYQPSKGGETYCPLERDQRILGNATPGLAQLIAHKYAENDANAIKADLEMNHGRSVQIHQIQRIADLVAEVAQQHQSNWNYRPKIEATKVHMLSLLLDGTTILMHSEKGGCAYKIGMCGLVSLYDKEGNILDTYYIATAPEAGKETFFSQLDNLWQNIKYYYPQAKTTGISDGAKEFEDWLKDRTETQILDFHHAAEYVNEVAKTLGLSHLWTEQMLNQLKHDPGGVEEVIKSLEELEEPKEALTENQGSTSQPALEEEIKQQEKQAAEIAAELEAWDLANDQETIEAALKKQTCAAKRSKKKILKIKKKASQTKDTKQAEKLQKEIKAEQKAYQQHQDEIDKFNARIRAKKKQASTREELERRKELEKQLQTCREKGATLSIKKKWTSNKRDPTETEALKSAIRYIKNNRWRMDYANYAKNNYPIGSGTIEGACKSVIKERVCQSGMRWKTEGVGKVLILRALLKSSDFWEQFFAKVRQYGYGIFGKKSAKWEYIIKG